MTIDDSPRAAALLIGNELLSGRTQDLNLAHLADRLGERGIRVAEARLVPDEPDAIVTAVNALRAAHDLVFTSGGIGPTHDDITADAIAAAFGVPIGVDAEARRRLEVFAAARGFALNEDRLRMARIPEGAVLIDNPVSAAPGFRLGNVHVLAGVPSIMRAMLETLLPGLPQGARVLAASVFAHGVGEGDVASALRRLQAANPDVDIGSYPGLHEGRPRLELVARSTDAQALERVRGALEALLADRRG